MFPISGLPESGPLPSFPPITFCPVNVGEAAPMVCEACSEPIASGDADRVEAHVQVNLTGSGEYRETSDSPVSFHERCFPCGDPRYRQSSWS
jgi:hypothetical protein